MLKNHCWAHPVQVDKAWEYLLKSKEVDIPDMRCEVSVQRTDGGPSGRGIYMREPQDVAEPLFWNVFVSPKLHEVSLSFVEKDDCSAIISLK